MSKKDTSFLKKLGAEIHRRRKALGWSQEKLAQEAELTFKHISKIERALTTPSITTIYHLATALKTSPAELLGFTRSPEHKPDPTLVFEELLELLKERPKLQAEFVARLVEELKKSIK